VLGYSVPAASEPLLQRRARRSPTWMGDYIIGDALTEEDAMNFCHACRCRSSNINQA